MMSGGPTRFCCNFSNLFPLFADGIEPIAGSRYEIEDFFSELKINCL